MAKMNKKTREDLRSLAAASVDLKAFELRAHVYFAASRHGDVGTPEAHRLMREAVSLFVAVKAPVGLMRPANVFEHPNARTVEANRITTHYLPASNIESFG
jgi:hypothetical protein